MILIIISLVSAPPSIVWTALPETDLIAVEPVGDANGNGTEDVVASPPFSTGSGLYCFDGLTGETLWTNPDVPGARCRGKSPQSCTGGGSASRRPGKPRLHAMAARSRRGFDRSSDAA